MKHAVKHIHFVGIGGAGMSGIAEILHNLGYRVSGSDAADSAVTQRLAGLVGEVVVNAAIDAAAARFRCRVLKRTEAAADIRQPDAGGVKGPITEDFREHLGCRRAVGGVPRYVFRMIWGDQQRLPVALSGGFGVAVAVGAANSRDRTPEVVRVFGVPGGDA
jgi:hypothetical protein